MLWRLQSPHLSTLEFRSSPNIGQEVQDLLLGLAEGAADPSQVDRSILSRLGWCPLPSGLWWPSRPYVLCATPFRCRTPSPLRCVRPPVPGVGACISPQAPLAYVWRGAATIFGCDAPVRAASQSMLGLVDSGQGLLILCRNPTSSSPAFFATGTITNPRRRPGAKAGAMSTSSLRVLAICWASSLTWAAGVSDVRGPAP